MELQKLEMIPCPKCGRPFPKKRKELGYNYCIECSTEKSFTALIEGTQDGDGDDTVHSTIYILSQEEAEHINRSKQELTYRYSTDEPVLDLRATEDLDLDEECEEEESEESNEEEE